MLAADPDDMTHRPQHRKIPLIIDLLNRRVVPVDPENQHRQIIRPERDTVDTLQNKLVNQQDSRGNLAHYPELEIRTTLQTLLFHNLLRIPEILQGPDKRQHNMHIRQLELLPHLPNRPTLQPEHIRLLHIPERAPETQQRIRPNMPRLPLILLSTRQSKKLVRLEIQTAIHNRLRRKRRSHLPHTLRKRINHPLPATLLDQQPGMLPHGEHHVLRPQQPHTISVRLPGNLLRQLWQRDVHVDSRRGNRNDSRDLLARSSSRRFENVLDKALIDNPRLGINSVLLASLQNLRSVPRPDNTRNPHFARNNRRMTSRAAILCDDCSGYLHVGNPVWIRHPSNKNVL